MGKKNSEFDDYALEYRDIHTKNVRRVSGVDSDYFCEYKIREIFDRQYIRKDSTWLDLGCGDGTTAKYIKKYFPDCKYIGIDVSQKSIEIARKRYGEDNIAFDYYDGEKIPYEDNSFDIVFIACVLHHITPKNRPLLLQECHRVLKLGGKIIVFEHNPYNPVTRKMVNTCIFDENAILITARELSDLFRMIGLEGKIQYTIFFPRKKMFSSLLRLEKYFRKIPLGGQFYGVFEQ